MTSAPAIRYHGAKYRLAPWIIARMPAHTCYVESFGGAAGVLLRKEPSYAEVYNDLDGDIVNFFRVLRDPVLREQLIEQCELTPYARQEFEDAWEPTDDAVERARRIAVRAMMGFGAAGASKGVTGFRIDTARKYSTAQHCWLRYPKAISAAGQRLGGVLIENRPAAEVIAQHDRTSTLHFIDPPYVHSTRSMRTKGGYRHELDDAQHGALLDQLATVQGMVMLCGYRSKLYDARLAHWTRHETSAVISGNRGAKVRTECLWLNPACQAQLERRSGSLFEGAVA